MREFNRRGLLGAGLGAAAALSMTGCGSSGPSESGGAAPGKSPEGGKGTHGNGGGAPGKQIRLIGDGSAADTGKQPKQPAAPVPLEPGRTPPQFVIFSWDGAGEVGNGSFRVFSNWPRNSTRR